MNKNFAVVVLVLALVSLVAATMFLAGNNPETDGSNQTKTGPVEQVQLKKGSAYEEVKEFVKSIFWEKTGTKEPNQLKKFSSYDELEDFLKTNRENYSRGFGGFERISTTGFAKTSVAAAAESSIPASATDYSATNIQVEGVDEADIVKNDGKYIYTVVGNKLVIVNAYPAEDAKVVSETLLEGTPTEIFVNRDKLVVFAHDYSYDAGVAEKTDGGSIASPTTTVVKAVKPYSGTKTRMDVYDVSSREEPKRARSVVVSGSYHDSRMIGNYVYAVVNQPVYYYPYGSEEPVLLPVIAENNAAKEVAAQDIYYFDSPAYGYNYVNIIAVNTQNDEEEYNSKTFLAENTQNMYVSMGNIYVTYTKWNNLYTTDNTIDEVVVPVLPGAVGVKVGEIRKSALEVSEKMMQINEVLNSYISSLSSEENAKLQQKTQQRMVEFEKELAKRQEQTVVHKIAISNGQIEYKGQGSVPGHVLNQFSMDEHNGYFRMATTTTSSLSRFTPQVLQVTAIRISEVSATPNTSSKPFQGMPSTMPNPPTMQQPTSQNNVYVLDKDLKVVGAVEDLAPGEKIYSARFIGNRAYLVTFKKVDPLFVIDLSEPEQPKVLGRLKIPGYSDYLHPYDENHIIGIGKEAVVAEQGDFAWYQGIKLALFDVSDPENPREVSKYNIGDRGTDSYALQDHKAFLFSKDKKLLVIPVLLAEIDETKYAGKVLPYAYGDYVWQGAYVLSLDTESGFQLKGRVTHLDIGEGKQQMLKSGYYFRSDYEVKRSLYIDNVLYTVSERLIKMNGLEDLEEVNRVRLPNGESQKRFVGV